MRWAKPGARCVCIREDAWIDAATNQVTTYGPKPKEILIVSFVADSPTRGVGLQFTQYPIDDHGCRPIFPIRYFRPLVEQSDDVALFSEILDRVGEPV